jgi:hypothetical protein
MTIRELQPSYDEDLLEPEHKPGTISIRIPTMPKIPKLSLTGNSIEDLKSLMRPAGQFLMGLILVWFGAINTGSAFTQATHFSGLLSTIFYTYQAGTVMISVGSILVYDCLKRTGYI